MHNLLWDCDTGQSKLIWMDYDSICLCNTGCFKTTSECLGILLLPETIGIAQPVILIQYIISLEEDSLQISNL